MEPSNHERDCKDLYMAFEKKKLTEPMIQDGHREEPRQQRKERRREDSRDQKDIWQPWILHCCFMGFSPQPPKLKTLSLYFPIPSLKVPHFML